jgi:hypothetical protein
MTAFSEICDIVTREMHVFRTSRIAPERYLRANGPCSGITSALERAALGAPADFGMAGVLIIGSHLPILPREERIVALPGREKDDM